MKVFIHNNPLYAAILKYMLQLFVLNKKLEFEYVDSRQNAELILDETEHSDLPIAIDFYNNLKEKKFDHNLYFKNDCLIRAGNSKPDLLATCFYMINSLQEYNSAHQDELGRFTYANSYQEKFNNITGNLVQQYFNELAKHPKFSKAQFKDEHSSVFISHDIDNVTTAWIEDGFAALKHGQLHHVFRLLFNAAIQKPGWLNMDKIMDINDEYGLRSTFFWLANKGRVNKRMVNADYDVRDAKIQKVISLVKERGFENGIHKSISDESFQSEADKLGFGPLANRFHYLKFNLPKAYSELEAAGIKLDASLGFAEHMGFRNSYGQAFQPYDLAHQKPFDLVEIPLHVMDRTFNNYMNVPVGKISATVIDFFEKNKYNCSLSLLWHNNFFNSIKYKGYLAEYKKIIAYLYEAKFKSLSQQEIINKYSIGEFK